MAMRMDITLHAGQVLQLQNAKGSFKESLGVDLADMTDEELQSYMNPTDEDYILIPVRMLSAAAVQNDTINFGHEGGKALQEAVTLFSDLTILKDHMFSVDNWIGRTEGAFWDTLTAGAPAGITGMMRIDTKADHKVARGLISGALDSVSVTISFEYEKSHPKMSDMDFFMNLGDVVDGVTVQALVTKVNRVYELSVVWQGADKYAKTVNDDGTIRVPGTRNSNSLNLQPNSQEESVDPKKLAALLGLSLGDNPTEESITAALKAALDGVPTLKAELEAATTAKTELAAQVTTLTAASAAAATEVATLKTQVETLTAQAKVGEVTLSTTRNEALRLYNLVEGSKATESLRQLIGNASLDVAQSFIDSYKDRAEQIAPLKCTKCGCTELSRQQAQQPKVPGTGNTKPTSKLEAERLTNAVNSIHG